MSTFTVTVTQATVLDDSSDEALFSRPGHVVDPHSFRPLPVALPGSLSVSVEDDEPAAPTPSFNARLMKGCGVALNLLAIGVSIAAAVVLGVLVSAALTGICYGILGLLALYLICAATAKDGFLHKASKFILKQGLHTVGAGLKFVWEKLPPMPQINFSRLLCRRPA